MLLNKIVGDYDHCISPMNQFGEFYFMFLIWVCPFKVPCHAEACSLHYMRVLFFIIPGPLLYVAMDMSEWSLSTQCTRCYFYNPRTATICCYGYVRLIIVYTMSGIFFYSPDHYYMLLWICPGDHCLHDVDVFIIIPGPLLYVAMDMSEWPLSTRCARFFIFIFYNPRATTIFCYGYVQMTIVDPLPLIYLVSTDQISQTSMPYTKVKINT